MLIWIAVTVTLAGAAFVMASCDLMGDLGRAVPTHHYKDATLTANL
jgi:hypothetical protein